MDNNSVKKHICNNTYINMDREDQLRIITEQRALDGMTRREEEHTIPHENKHPMCDHCENRCKNEHGGVVYVLNVGKSAYRNNNFRESIWTGNYLQTTLMSIPVGEDIGVELHKDTDQYIRVEYGSAMVMTGKCENNLCNKQRLYQNDAVFIPAGTWHNIVNIGRCPLKLSSVYAPPHHPRCTVEKNK